MRDFVKTDSSSDEISAFIHKILGGPEADLDITKVKVDEVELDSAEQRARARIRILGTNLLSKESLDIAKIIFLYFDGQWMLDIKNVSP